MSTVVFLTGQTMGDACGSAGRTLQVEFEQLGYEYLEIHLTETRSAVTLDQTIKQKTIEFAYSFVGVCADLAGKTEAWNGSEPLADDWRPVRIAVR